MAPPYTSIMMAGVGAIGQEDIGYGAPADLVFGTAFADASTGDAMTDIVPEVNPHGATMSSIYTINANGAASGVGTWGAIDIYSLPSPPNIWRQIHVMYRGTPDWHSSKDQAMHWHSHDDASGNYEFGYFNHYTNNYGSRQRSSSSAASDTGNVSHTVGYDGIGQLVISLGDQHIQTQQFSARHGAIVAINSAGVYVKRTGDTLSTGDAARGVRLYGKPGLTDHSFQIMNIMVWDHDVTDFKWSG